MKFVECANLQYLTSVLDGVDLGDSVIHAKLEAYCCRQAKNDRRLTHIVERRLCGDNTTGTGSNYDDSEPPPSPGLTPTFAALLSLSSPEMPPPLHLAGTPPPEPYGLKLLSQTVNQNIFSTLVACLNSSYDNEFDFSEVPPDEFKQETVLSETKSAINSILAKYEYVDDAKFAFIKEDFWQTIEELVPLSDSDIYSYKGDDCVAELDSAALWSQHYFFYHKRFKRILLVRWWATNKRLGKSDGDLSTDRDDKDDDDDDWTESTGKNIDVHYRRRSQCDVDAASD